MPMIDIRDPATGWTRPDASAIIYAAMLFPQPDEADKRLVQEARERLHARELGVIDSVSQAECFRVIKANEDPKWRNEIDNRERAGWRAGHIAYELFRLIKDDPVRANVANAARLAASRPVGDAESKLRRNDKRMIERAWNEVLPAVHLWASAYFAKREDWLSYSWRFDPHGALMRMLRHAQAFHQVFETFAPRIGRNAGKPILPPDISWRPSVYFTDELYIIYRRLTHAERAIIGGQRLLTDQRST
jgi:hypothetical protein